MSSDSKTPAFKPWAGSDDPIDRTVRRWGEVAHRVRIAEEEERARLRVREEHEASLRAAAPAPAAETHQTKRRADPLAAVLTLAARQAADAADWQSVWAALVALAQSPGRPAPLVGYVEGEGVQYRADDVGQPVRYLTRSAFRKRFTRKG